MTLSNISLSNLKHVRKLLQKKEEILSQIDALDRQLEGIGEGGGRGPTASLGRGRVGGGRKGLLKAKILKVLKKAGAEGVHVQALAKKLNVKEPNIRVWFYVTGKKIKEVTQIAPATYRWGEGSGRPPKGKARAKA